MPFVDGKGAALGTLGWGLAGAHFWVRLDGLGKRSGWLWKSASGSVLKWSADFLLDPSPLPLSLKGRGVSIVTS